MPIPEHGHERTVNANFRQYWEDRKDSALKEGRCYDWIAALTTLEIPKMLDFDQETKKWVCKNKELLDLLSIITNGDPKWIKAYFKNSGKLRKQALADVDGRIRMVLLANALKRAQDGDAAFSKHALEIIKDCDSINHREEDRRRKYVKDKYDEKTAGKRTKDAPRGLRDLD